MIILCTWSKIEILRLIRDQYEGNLPDLQSISALKLTTGRLEKGLYLQMYPVRSGRPTSDTEVKYPEKLQASSAYNPEMRCLICVISSCCLRCSRLFLYHKKPITTAIR